MRNDVEFIDDRHFKVGSTSYYCTFPKMMGKQPAGHLPVMKPRSLVERLVRLFESAPAKTIVELGIRDGGSTALIAELAQPTRLVAIEIAEHPALALSQFIASRGLEEVVRPRYGIDQADRDSLTAAIDEELGTEPIDLVIDDASHWLTETRSSFETLFPRLRPGALFVIEDWAVDHTYARGMARVVAADPVGPVAERLSEHLRANGFVPRRQPLSYLVIELLLACATRDDAVESVTIDEQWVVIRRGPAELDHREFRISQRYEDHFDQASAGR